MNEERTGKCLRQVEDIRCHLGHLFSSFLYQENPDRNNKLWNIVSTEGDLLHMQVLLECRYI